MNMGVGAVAGLAIGLGVFGGHATADADDGSTLTAPLASRTVQVHRESGIVQAQAGVGRAVAQVVYSTEIRVKDATWLRLAFEEVVLSGAIGAADASYLAITSLLDGATQYLHAEHVQQWGKTSAYFNGDAVRLEIFAFENTGDNYLRMGEVTAGEFVPMERSICGSVDDRELSDDPRAARHVPIGCTSWLITNGPNCMLTAGHCSTDGADVMEFNVPLSSPGGSIIHPPPEDQYSVDPASVQQSSPVTLGNDWGYFGVFNNSNTGLSPTEAQGDAYQLAAEVPPMDGREIRITGFGTTGSPVPSTWNQAQKTHSGPFTEILGTTIRYAADTTGGNSGSAVLDDTTNTAFGIHTNAGCNSVGGNQGTSIANASLQAALQNPLGVCTPLGLAFDYPDGLPEYISPDGSTQLRVVVSPDNGPAPEPNTGMLHINDGSGWTQVAMAQTAPNEYIAVFDNIACPAAVDFYFSAENADGEVKTDPPTAPTVSYTATAAANIQTFVSLDFETNDGWTVENENLTDGAWERGVPVNSDRGDPVSDSDGSGQCWVTDNAEGNSDVDGGPTRLISRNFDLAGIDNALVSYDRWLSTLDADSMVVEVSNDAGASWTIMETIGTNQEWTTATFRVADFVSLTDSVRFRFSVSDQPNNSVTEAGIDNFRIVELSCDPSSGCDADFNGDGLADFFDVQAFLNAFQLNDPATDLNDDGLFDFFDVQEFLNVFQVGCA